MTYDKFKTLVEQARLKHPIWFGLESDSPATDTDLQETERRLGATLPSQYREFLKEYGGGYFALSNVFSVQTGSDWNLFEINQRAGFVGTEFVAVSDNGSGDFYGFTSSDGRCHPEIWIHDHETAQWQKTEFGDFLEFLHNKALSKNN